MELNPVLCTNFTARGVTIDTHGYNNDGCDPENCNYVLIENCFFNTGDDCIAVKAAATAMAVSWAKPVIRPRTSSSATTLSQTATAASPAAAR